MNYEAMDNLLRVVRNVPEEDLNMLFLHKCALGHCVRDPWFQKQGAILDGVLPYFKGQMGFDGAALQFEISYNESLETFAAMPPTIPGVKEKVLSKIERLIQKYRQQDSVAQIMQDALDGANKESVKEPA